MSSQTTQTLTPSELVYFHGEEFAKRAFIGNVTLMHIDAKVAADQLGRAIFAAAFLGAEQSGSLRLETRQKKRLLGLAKANVLYAEPSAMPAPWPEPSLEAQIVRIAAQRKANGDRHQVSGVIYELIGEDSVNPWQTLAEQVQAHLGRRGVLRAITEKKLKIFTVTRYELPESTSADLLRQPLAPVKTLLESCEHSRPQVWKLLLAQIKSGMDQRTEKGGSDD